MWVCAVDLKDDHTYQKFERLHQRGELLPGEDDERRRDNEAAYGAAEVFHDAVRSGAPDWLHDARSHPAQERRFSLPGGAVIRLYIIGNQGSEEIWLAMPKADAEVPVIGLLARQRAFIIAAIESNVGEFDAQERFDWPLGRLPDYELACLIVT
jgi:hypothetical protein